MLVKIMGPEDCPDDDSRACHTLFEGVTWYRTYRKGDDGGTLIIEMTTKDCPEVQEYALDGNVYVMNDSGKTIAHVGVAPYHPLPLDDNGDDPNDTDYDPGQPPPPRARVRLDGLDARNHFSVPKRSWRKWTLAARHAFNAVYAELGEVGQAHCCHPETLKKGMPDEEWETIRWNAAWLAAHRISGFEKQKVKAKEDSLFVGYAD